MSRIPRILTWVVLAVLLITATIWQWNNICTVSRKFYSLNYHFSSTGGIAERIIPQSNLNPELIRQCRHFHFGYPPLMNMMFDDEGKELGKIFKVAKEAGATTSCDMSLPDPTSPSGRVPWRKILQRILPYIDIHLPSIEETLYMLWPDEFLARKAKHNNAELINYIAPQEYSKTADEILTMGAKIVALKSGHRGFYVKTGSKDGFAKMGAAKPKDFDNWSNRELWAPAFVVDNFGSATGSGDSSIAGFLSAYLRGLNIEDALKYATCVGLQNVRVLDAVSGIKTWDETTRMIKANMPMIDTHITENGWNWHSEIELWAGPHDNKLKK